VSLAELTAGRCRRGFESEIASLQSAFDQMLHQLADVESKQQIAETRATEAEKRSEALSSALNESRSRCSLEQQQNNALQLQVQRYEAEFHSATLLSSQLAAAEACISDLQQKFNDSDKRAFAAERRADLLVQELRVRSRHLVVACLIVALIILNCSYSVFYRPASCRILLNWKQRHLSK
jgi:chromosome segregation ATPase